MSHVRSFDPENRDDENDRESGRQRLIVLAPGLLPRTAREGFAQQARIVRGSQPKDRI